MGEMKQMDTLATLVKAVEMGELHNVGIWMLTPGGLLAGSLVRYAQVEKRIKKEMPPESPGDELALYRWADEAVARVLAAEQGEQGQLHETCYLIDVSIFSGGRVLTVPFATVRLNMVSAWGLGVMRERTVNSPTSPPKKSASA